MCVVQHTQSSQCPWGGERADAVLVPHLCMRRFEAKSGGATVEGSMSELARIGCLPAAQMPKRLVTSLIRVRQRPRVTSPSPCLLQKTE
jgi:hypothetical protein